MFLKQLFESYQQKLLFYLTSLKNKKNYKNFSDFERNLTFRRLTVNWSRNHLTKLNKKTLTMLFPRDREKREREKEREKETTG
jgi:hypothetical protein